MRKIMIVTGGSRGIGAATVLLAATRGYAVCINFHQHADAADSLVQAITAKGGEAIAVEGNVALEKDVIRLFRTTQDQLGPVTALVNNAGILDKQSPLIEFDARRLQQIFSVNVIGSFLCAREAVKIMSRQHGGEGGSIVNMSSVAARTGSPGEYIDYAASKGAIDTMTVGLAREVAEQGIRVNAVRPGFIYTDMHASSGEPERVDRLSPTLPMKRGGYPDEVANAILWLVSDEASYTTGAIIDVAGGR